MNIKKITIICLTVWVVSVSYLSGGNLLKNMITEGKWEELPSIFLDDSYRVLKDYFAAARSVSIITSEGNKLTYKAKFNQEGEIGVITFDFREKDGKYLDAKIKNQIKPLYFVEKFKKYKASNIKITIGDAQIHFIAGFFYETTPFDSLLIFKGKWRFQIKPSDQEEQLTLSRIYKRDYFSQLNNEGIFVLPEKDFLQKLSLGKEVKILDKESQALYKMYRDAYGINIKQFNEYWYLPFPKGTHLVIFPKEKDSFYYYSFNPNAVPDTRLSDSQNNDLILSYNSQKGLKFSFGGDRQLSELKVSVFFNPDNNFISGTTSITYKEPTSLKLLNMADGLQLVGTLNLDAKGINLFKKRNTYYFLGPEDANLSIYFRGSISPNRENFELFKYQTEEEPEYRDMVEEKESFYFLSKTQDFYPNPGDDFVKTNVTVTVPGGLNCLASGHLLEKIPGEPASFKFGSESSKGISVVTGDFAQFQTVSGRIPLHIYTLGEYRTPRFLDYEELKQGCDFFTQTFGPLDLPEINILLRRSLHEGGVSNTGFIVVNFYERKRGSTPVTTGSKLDKRILSPILIRERVEDYILHELAHQWWGGVISWKSYQDNWLTEGLSHFSVLYFLKRKLPEKQFNRLVKKMKRWVYRCSDSGPIIYGTRIRSLENSMESYQSVIYNKSALVFLMALDWLGEEEFNRRLKSVLAEFKYRSITSMQFIRQFCGDNTELFAFFRKWVYSRRIPRVELGIVRDDPAFDAKESKRVVLSISQIDTDFIFPLKLRVTSQKGDSNESVIIKEKVQKLIITRDSAIQAINIEDWITPVKERKLPQPPRR